jgi:hypothetical protein
MEYAKAFWGAATVWRTRYHDAKGSSRVNCDQTVILVCLEMYGDHAGNRDPRVMFNL